jgi:stage II sporulation protein D
MTAQANGEVIDAVYSSDCGGHTEANEDAWSRTQPKSYLRPVIDAPADGGVSYCASNRSHAWSYLLTPERLRSLAGSTAEEVELEVIDTSASGRVRRLELRAGRGPDETGSTPRVFTGDGWRRLLGPNQLKSLRFEVKRRPDGVELVGHGWGHGVGLCQFGAQGMARSGADHTEILRHYYTGITIGRFQTGVAVPSTTYKPHRDDTRVPAVSANAAVPPAKRARPSPRAGLRPSRTGRRPDSAASTRG